MAFVRIERRGEAVLEGRQVDFDVTILGKFAHPFLVLFSP